MSDTYWAIYSLVFASVLALIVMRRNGQVPRKEAMALVKHGAIIVDVRDAAEFQRGHLSQAFNMPMAELEVLLPGRMKDRNHAILLHCQSGMRSKKAKDTLTHMGYTKVFVLGSYERAFRIVSGRNL